MTSNYAGASGRLLAFKVLAVVYEGFEKGGRLRELRSDNNDLRTGNNLVFCKSGRLGGVITYER